MSATTQQWGYSDAALRLVTGIIVASRYGQSTLEEPPSRALLRLKSKDAESPKSEYSQYWGSWAW